MFHQTRFFLEKRLFCIIFNMTKMYRRYGCILVVSLVGLEHRNNSRGWWWIHTYFYIHFYMLVSHRDVYQYLDWGFGYFNRLQKLDLNARGGTEMICSMQTSNQT